MRPGACDSARGWLALVTERSPAVRRERRAGQAAPTRSTDWRA